MGKGTVKYVDGKTTKVVGIIEEAASEIIEAAQDAQKLIAEMSNEIGEINNGLEREEMTKDDARAVYGDKVRPLKARLQNRFKRMVKNTKAINGMLLAIKAMADDEDKGK